MKTAELSLVIAAHESGRRAVIDQMRRVRVNRDAACVYDFKQRV